MYYKSYFFTTGRRVGFLVFVFTLLVCILANSLSLAFAFFAAFAASFSFFAFSAAFAFAAAFAFSAASFSFFAFAAAFATAFAAKLLCNFFASICIFSMSG